MCQILKQSLMHLLFILFFISFYWNKKVKNVLFFLIKKVYFCKSNLLCHIILKCKCGIKLQTIY